MQVWPDDVFPTKLPSGLTQPPIVLASYIASIIFLLRALQQKSSMIKRSHFGRSFQMKQSKTRGFITGKSKVPSKASLTLIQISCDITHQKSTRTLLVMFSRKMAL